MARPATSCATSCTMGCTSATAERDTYFIKMDTAAPVSHSAERRLAVSVLCTGRCILFYNSYNVATVLCTGRDNGASRFLGNTRPSVTLFSNATPGKYQNIFAQQVPIMDYQCARMSHINKGKYTRRGIEEFPKTFLSNCTEYICHLQLTVLPAKFIRCLLFA